ncbi:hypothetical protein GO308_00905 [Sphingomonas sp. SFZ2018-12]|nr:hypothetical protein [Sphingomonas sp. SFZ2018-12]
MAIATSMAALQAVNIQAATKIHSSVAQIVELSAVESKTYFRFSSSHDVTFFQDDGRTLERLHVEGGYDVRLIGANFQPVAESSSATLLFKTVSNSVNVIGTRIDLGDASARDGIAVDGGPFRPDVTIERSMVLDVSGTHAGVHGDIFQAYGGIGALTISDFVGTTNYQGIFLGGTSGQIPSRVTLDNVHLGYAAGPNAYPVLLWLGGGSDTRFSTTLRDVTLDTQAASRGTDYATMVHQGDALVRTSLTGGQVSFATADVTGGLSFGNGDAVRSSIGAVGAGFDSVGELARSFGVDRVVDGTDGADRLVSPHAAILLAGSGNDTLVGGAGRDYLSGGWGADVMSGGGGDDVYVVDNSWDQVIEGAGEGNDTVLSTISYTLGAHVENLTLAGTGAINGTGNAAANVIVGGLGANRLSGGGGNDQLQGAEGNDVLNGDAGDDTLDGGTGQDTLTGGDGNDVYVVDDRADVVVESSAAASGIDTVISAVTYTLGSNVENLALTGTASLSGTGNALDNAMRGNDGANVLNGLAGDDALLGGAGNDTLSGGDGNDRLDGGAGVDRLAGGAGNDIFVFRPGEANGDRVTDFAAGDRLSLEGYGRGATVSVSGNVLTVRHAGGEDRITVDGAPLKSSDWSLVDAAATPVAAPDLSTLIKAPVDVVSKPLVDNVATVIDTGPRTSVYINNNSADVAVAEQFLGRKLDAIQLHGGVASWDDWLSSPAWIADQVANVAADKMWSIGLIPWGASLAQAAAGAYDDKYVALARQFVEKSAGDAQIYIRVGWEMNTTGWNPWSAIGQEDQYVGAFRNFVDAFRSVSDKFVFEWAPNINTGVNTERFYPGDDYVDVIGFDFYYDIRWDPKDPVEAWNYFVSQPFGLQWQQDFARAHGKPTAASEWGVNSDTAGPFIALAAQWFKDHGFLYQNYWNSDLAFSGSLTDGSYPDAAKVFQDVFGAQSYAGPVTVGPAPASDAVEASRGPRADFMLATTGDDVFAVDHAGDVVSPDLGGVDLVKSTVSYTLGAGLENLKLDGASAIDGYGNSLDNVLGGNDAANRLSGNAGNDTLRGFGGDDYLDGGWGNDLLDGGSGVDTMSGGDGNDVFVVNHAGDTVVEWINAGKGGTDTVVSAVDYTLGSALENLVLNGSAPTSARGNALANILIGNRGNNVLRGEGGDDVLNGGRGADMLYGGTGNDVFVFRAGEANGDRIMDFARGDRIRLEGYGSGAYATVSGTQLTIHHGGGREVVDVAGVPVQPGEWSFGAITPNAAEAALTSVGMTVA